MTTRAFFVGCLLTLGLLASSPSAAHEARRPLPVREIESQISTAISQGRVAEASDQPETAAKKAEREPGKREGNDPPKSAPTSKAAAPGKESGQMVLVAGGLFFMGCNESVDTQCSDNEKPGRMVEVDTFKVDKFEVTVADYARCVNARACSSEGLTMPSYEGMDQPTFAEFCNWQQSGRENHPVNCVNWYQARDYCAWAGKLLPTEVEWEKAARGTDGRKYPWGNAGYGGGRKVANIADESTRGRYPEWPAAVGYDDGYVGTAPVGSFPAGAAPGGALDMIGNVWEWTADSLEGQRVFRGGSWDLEPEAARASTRRFRDANRRGPALGFRCVQ